MRVCKILKNHGYRYSVNRENQLSNMPVRLHW